MKKFSLILVFIFSTMSLLNAEENYVRSAQNKSGNNRDIFNE